MPLGDNMRDPLYPCVGFCAGPDAVGIVVTATFGVKWDRAWDEKDFQSALQADHYLSLIHI